MKFFAGRRVVRLPNGTSYINTLICNEKDQEAHLLDFDIQWTEVDLDHRDAAEWYKNYQSFVKGTSTEPETAEDLINLKSEAEEAQRTMDYLESKFIYQEFSMDYEQLGFLAGKSWTFAQNNLEKNEFDDEHEYVNYLLGT